MITLKNLTKIYNTGSGETTAVNRVSMEIPAGKICILLGPSGCGKTTTLKMINRIIPITSGKVFINGEDTDKDDEVILRRKIGYVIQQIGLFPNLTIEENINVVPKLLKWDKNKMHERAKELMDMVALDPSVYLKRYPKELSGGQQQRIGVIRALAADPPVMLMDEPFGAIDPINRATIQDEFLTMQKELKKTILFVSHDIGEAVKMGDLVALFNNGALTQFDSPDEILAKPKNDFVRGFVGEDRYLRRLVLFKVKEAMDPMVVIRSTETAERATAIMKENEYKNIVVVDENGRPMGFVHLNDIKEKPRDSLSKHLEPLPGTIDEENNLRMAVSGFYSHNANWLVCVDSAGVAVGSVNQQGVVRALGTITHKKNDVA